MDGLLVTRFAPAPTGYLHLGHVVNARHVWQAAREAGGRVLLRIEDHDRQRCRPEYERAMLEDLEWLGFTPDDVSRQSERHAVYEEALEELRRQGLVYACDCPRAALTEHEPGTDGERRYPGTCRGRGVPEGPGTGLRVRLDPAIVRFDDLRRGPQTQCPSEQCGDLLVRDRLGNWTYQFVAAVDDFRQGVTLVIRGDDLLASTGRQIQLARMLGRSEPPRFLHHALVMKSPHQKLSKSDGDTGIRDLRARGWSRDEVLATARENPAPGHRVLPV
ncbi:MAG TPA: glutamate--tRNA ligase family protein [Vicinamibacterales bacterium]